MSMLDRKLARDLWHLRMQIAAVALVMACGVATVILALGAYRSLDDTRAAFYERYSFASVFASATRAPVSLKDDILRIPGVAAAELRIVRAVVLDMEGMAEPATGIAVSIPDHGEPGVDRLYLRSGRLPEPGRDNEVAITETFAKAHRLVPGNSFTAIMNGRECRLIVTGIVLSPEYIYAIGPGDLMPDNRRFGVFFMPRSQLEGIFNMKDSFNNLVATTLRNANDDAVIEKVDAILKPYGGTGAYPRRDQLSHAFLDGELTQLRAMAFVIPPIFLFVAAFLVNMILTRMIALEREQIGLLKAVGYSELAIGWHYTKFVIAIAAIGLVIGSGAGWWLGRGLTRLYAQFYSFPFLVFRNSVDLYVLAAGVTLISALAGAARAIRSVVALPAAVAMRAPSPTLYRRSLAPGFISRFFSQLTVMAMRHLVRWPMRSALTILGTSLSVALLVASLFSFASIDFMIDAIYFRSQRQDAFIAYSDDKAPSATEEIAHLPGVMRVEPFRSAPVILRNGRYERRLGISGIAKGSDLSRILDLDLNTVTIPPSGLLLTERVANILHARRGDVIEAEIPQQGGRIVRVAVTDVVQSYLGLGVYMRNDALDRLMGDGSRVSGASVSIDADAYPAFFKVLKKTPAIGVVGLLDRSRELFRQTINENMAISMTIYVALAVIITFGVIYNSARIQLAERARELAGLRVLGFTRAEVSSVLLTELAVIVFLAQPLGWVLGYALSWSIVQGIQSDLFRVPLVLTSATYAEASLVVLAAALISALIVRRRIDRLDLIRVLKTRD
jgi:putative ABC transport system permease protein